MHRVKRVKKLDYDPLPADYFDLMAGADTGGLYMQFATKQRYAYTCTG
jgi:hypothetical protein